MNIPLHAAGLLAGAALWGVMLPATAHAHIKMLLPTPWIVEDGGGNPQKAGPCGVAASDTGYAATQAVSEFRAGETITVKWTETIAHPGYFRIALAANRADLKDPALSFDPANCNVDNTKVPSGPHDNVLADGLLLQNNDGTPARPGSPNYTVEVTLPNAPCEKCTLQLIQFMENHPPSCIYYHCADIRIVAAPGAQDAGASAGDAAVSGSSDAAVAPAPEPTPSPDAAAPSPSTQASGGDAGGADAGGAPPNDASGCGLAPGTRTAPVGLLVLALALTGLVARRRARPS